MDPDEYRNMFRRFFGYNPNFGQGRFPFDERPSYSDDDVDQSEKYNQPGAGSQDDFTNARGFSIYSDPLEINRFFEHQMDEMLKIFGGFGFGFEGFPNQSRPMLERFDDFKFGGDPVFEPEARKPEGYARDFMLKDHANGQPRPRVDTEVEWDKLDMDELDQLMSKKDKVSDPNVRSDERFPIFDLMPRQSGPPTSGAPNNFTFQSFGSSMSEKTVRNPNGGIETVRTVRNSDGSETITSRKQFGDKTYETVTTRDRHGQSSSEEKLINITESELDQFKESFGRQTVNQGSFSPAYDPRNEMIQGPLQDSTFYRMWDKFFGK